MFNGNYSMDTIISAIVILVLAGAFVFFMLWLAFPYARMRMKIRNAARTTASVNSFEVTYTTYGSRTVRHYRRWSTVEYSFIHGKDEFFDAKLTYERKPLFLKKFEYGDEFKVIYNKKDPSKNIPVYLLNRELWIRIPVTIIFLGIYGLIVYLTLFA